MTKAKDGRAVRAAPEQGLWAGAACRYSTWRSSCRAERRARNNGRAPSRSGSTGRGTSPWRQRGWCRTPEPVRLLTHPGKSAVTSSHTGSAETPPLRAGSPRCGSADPARRCRLPAARSWRGGSGAAGAERRRAPPGAPGGGRRGRCGMPSGSRHTPARAPAPPRRARYRQGACAAQARARRHLRAGERRQVRAEGR